MKSNSRKILTIVFITIISLIILSSCADREIVDECLTGRKYGFLGGLWHGIIAPIDFVLMLFNENVTMYAQNNNGGWYAFGFLLGSGGWGFLGGKSSKRRRKEY